MRVGASSATCLGRRARCGAPLPSPYTHCVNVANEFAGFLSLRTETHVQRGQAIFDCICLDERLLTGIGAAHQLAKAYFADKPPNGFLEVLRDSLGFHMRVFESEYGMRDRLSFRPQRYHAQ
eukprot:COSAG06_NODE_1187_length_10334_cov_68.868197_3_plen_122_part_00